MREILLAFFLFSAAAPLAAAESSWDSIWTQHFIVRTESPSASRGFGAELEKVFRGLRSELWSLSSWMDTGKVEVYLYKDRESYTRGRFRPPSWSGGLVHNSGRPGAEWSLAVYAPVSIHTLAHELTHLYFNSFFKGSSAAVPLWLNEGLAEMTAAEAVDPGRPGWRGPAPKSAPPLAGLLKLKAIPEGGADDFYLRAHSLVRFLKKGSSPLKFEKFCRELRDGETADRAFLSVYGFSTPEQLDKAWREWAGIPEVKKASFGKLK